MEEQIDLHTNVSRQRVQSRALALICLLTFILFGVATVYLPSYALILILGFIVSVFLLVMNYSIFVTAAVFINASLPRLGYQVSFLPFRLNVTDFLLLMLVLGAGLRLVLLKKSISISTKLIKAALLIFLTSFAVFFREIFTDGFPTALYDLIRFGVAPLLIFAIVFGLQPSGKNIRRLINAIILGGLLTALLGFLQYFIGTYNFNLILGKFAYVSSDTAISTLNGIESARIGSTFVHPNSLGAFMMMVSVLALGLAISESNNIKRFIYLVLFALFISMLALTASRSSLVGLLLGFLLLLFLTKIKLSRKIIISIVSVLLLIVIIFGAGGFLLVKFENLSTDVNVAARVAEYRAAFDLLPHRPFLGYGYHIPELAPLYMYHLTGSSSVQNEYIRERYTINGVVSNLFISILLRSGIIGLTTFGILIFEAFAALTNSRRKHNIGVYIRNLSGILIAVLGAIMMNGIFDHTFIGISYIYNLFLILIGIIAIVDIYSQTLHEQTGG